MKTRALLAAALALAACSEEGAHRVPPTDRFYFPIGLATTRFDLGTKTALIVASSNFDLRYSAEDGGTVLSVDPEASAGGGPLTLRGEGSRIGSYAGPVAVADSATCSVAGPAFALVASRYDDRIYQYGIGAAGELTCGAGCVRDAHDGFDDPLAVAVACGSGARRAYVGYLDPPNSSRGIGLGAWIGEIDLDSPSTPIRDVELGDGPVRGMAHDATTDRLWVTTQSKGARALLHSVVLSDPRFRGATPWEAVDTVDLFPSIRGLELRAIAVGSPPAAGVSRLFLTGRLYDAELQATSGGRPPYDVGGVLIVLDVTEGTHGRPLVAIRAVEMLGLGAGDVAIVTRGGGEPDLAVATATNDDLLFVYDDGTGRVIQMIHRDDLGAPRPGDRPLALAVDQPTAGGPAAVYSASFGDHLVVRFLLDPLDPSAPLVLERIGGLAP